MSRRSRRKQQSDGKPESASASKNSLKKWIIYAGGGAVALVLLGVVLSYVYIRSYIAGSEFNQQLEQDIGDALGGQVELSDLEWSGWDVEFDSLKIKDGRSVLRSAEINALSSGVSIGSVLSDAWDVKHIEMDSMSLHFGSADPDYVPVEKKKPTGIAAYLPETANLQTFEVNQFDGSVITLNGLFSMKGIRVAGESLGGENLEMNLKDGSVQLPLEIVSEAKHKQSTLSIIAGDIELKDGEFSIYDNNPLALEAYIDVVRDIYKFEGETTGVNISQFMKPGLKQKISGAADVSFKYLSTKLKGQLTTGKVSVQDCVVRDLIALRSLEAYTKNPQYRELHLTRCNADFEVDEVSTRIRNIEIDMDRALSIRGQVSVFGDDEIDGVIKLGLPTGTFSAIPGAEKKVFLPGSNNMNWATVRISGTLDDIKEDLSSQLIAAAAERMMEFLPELGDMVSAMVKSGELPAEFSSVLGDGMKGPLSSAKNIVESGTSLLGSLFEPRELNVKKKLTFVKDGAQVDLIEDWKINPIAKSSDPIATISVDDKLAAKLFLASKEGKMRAMSDAWRATHVKGTSRASEILTDLGLAAIYSVTTDKEQKFDNQDGITKGALFVQINANQVAVIKIESKANQEENLKNYLKTLAQSVSEKQAEKKGILDDVEQLIPDPKVLDQLIPF